VALDHGLGDLDQVPPVMSRVLPWRISKALSLLTALSAIYRYAHVSNRGYSSQFSS
jgi:hypothetical protein